MYVAQNSFQQLLQEFQAGLLATVLVLGGCLPLLVSLHLMKPLQKVW